MLLRRKMKDVNGVERGFCKVCGVKECPEFISEEGSAKCGYCFHVPVSHERKVCGPYVLSFRVKQVKFCKKSRQS